MIILNGKLYEPGAPEASALNRSFKYGDGLFESIRIHQGKPIFLVQHLVRLVSGMKVLKMKFHEDEFQAKIREEITRLTDINGIQKEGRVAVHVYRSGEGKYAPLRHEPYYLLEGYSLKDDLYNSSTSVTLTAFHDIPLVHSVLSPFKTANALPYVLGAIHAESTGFDDAVLFCDGYVADTAGANIFVVKSQKIQTPPLSSGIVDGIMRRQVLLLAEELRLSISEKKLKPRDLNQADEIFLTNSIRGIVSVRQWEDMAFDTRNSGITSFLKKCLAQYVGREVGE